MIVMTDSFRKIKGFDFCARATSDGYDINHNFYGCCSDDLTTEADFYF